MVVNIKIKIFQEFKKMKNSLLKVVKMGILSVSMASGLALANGGQDFETYIQSLALTQPEAVVDYSASYRTANGNPPFASQALLPEIPDAEFEAPSNAVALDISEIPALVTKMNSFINPTATGVNGGGKAIGLRSGMMIRKNNVWSSREVRNSDRVAIWDATLNNISWYPDANDSEGLRLTTGKFNMGSMPFTGKAYLDIPIANIKAVAGSDVVWFDAVADRSDPDKDKWVSPLKSNKNYYEVSLVAAPIIDFVGYFNKTTGEWKIMFVIDSNILPNNGNPGFIHPALDLKVFSHGHAIQN